MTSVLLVDDSNTILMSMTQILTKAGHEVDTAGDGRAALTKLQGGMKPSLVITDLNMPVMNGLELIAEARKLPSLRFTPIIMLTTESQQAMRDEGRKAGATGWVVKPVQAAELLGLIKRLVPGG